jgi:mannose-1-phosphate guanylyltransferase
VQPPASLLLSFRALRPGLHRRDEDHFQEDTMPRALSAAPWALLLAGGDGTRLKSLTQRIAGDGRPKQFCALVDGETLLDRTRRRADLVVRPDRQVIVVTRAHEAYYADVAGDVLPGRLAVQPENRGTATGILYPLLAIERMGGRVPLVILPSDHEVSDDRLFMGYVAAALDVVRAQPDVLVLLGIEARDAETEYGWIEPGEMPVDAEGMPLLPIKRFWEKPPGPLARTLLAQGCLWNSFVMVGWTSTFLTVLETARPDLVAAFQPVRDALGTPDEGAVVERVYRTVPVVGFSEQVLARHPGRLVTMRVKGVEWSDLGNAARVVASVRRSGRTPSWLAEGDLLSTA